MAGSQQVALITGASTGIGRAVATAFVDAGFTVVGTSRRASAAEPVAGAEFIDLDVTSELSVAQAVATVERWHGHVDVLVNNAGIGSSGAAEESSIEQAQQMFDINVFGVMRMTNAVLPLMRMGRSGRIINMSSIVGLMPQPYMAVYASTKFAVEGYTESLDHELREHGIRALLVEPAWTNTDFDANAMQVDQPLAVYADRRKHFEQYMAGAVRDGDAPEAVAKQVVAAATDRNPKLRYPVGRTGGVATMRRLVPTPMFDRQLRKLNNLPA